MKQKWFNPHLYAEGMRQLRLMGILFTAAAGLIALFIPLGEVMNSVYNEHRAATTVTYLEMNPLIPAAFCLVAPFLTLNMFSFLNKRESSDYYHAIPATRTCLFFSFFAAVITWLAIFVFGTMLLSVICHLCFPNVFIINFPSVIQISLNCFAAGLLVAACVAISMSVTGTLLVNVLMALILIFLPRALMKVVLSTICSLFPLVDGLVFAPLMNTQYNIPAGYIFGYYSGDPEAVLSLPSGLAYTLVLALVYIAVACFLFARRRSEAAGHAAPTPRLQALYRFLVGFTISSFVTRSVYMDIHTQKHGLHLDDAAGYLFLYVLTLFVVLVFEILCTRRWKGLIRRGAVTLLLLVVANAALAGGLAGADLLLRSYSPHAEHISSVRVMEFEGYDSGYGGSDYFDEKTSSVKLTDPEIKKMVSTQLRHTLDVLAISEDRYYQESSKASSMVVSIQSGGISHLRRIMVYEDDIELLANKLADNKTYKDIYMNIPTNFTHIRTGEMHRTVDEDTKKFIAVLQDEVNEIGFEEWFALLNGRSMDKQLSDKYGDSASTQLTTLYLFTPNTTGWSEIEVPLYPAVLPKTCAAYLELHAQKQGNREALLDALCNRLNQCDGLNITLTNATFGSESGVDKPESTYYYWDGSELKENGDAVRAFAESLRQTLNTPIDPTKPLCFLSVSVRTENEYDVYEYEHYEGFYALPADVIIPGQTVE